MRLPSTHCAWSLLLLCALSGCATFDGPLTQQHDSLSDGDEQTRQLIAEANRRAKAGDVDGARRILADLDDNAAHRAAPGLSSVRGPKSSKNDIQQTSFERADVADNGSDIEQMIEELVQQEPAQERQARREQYRAMSPTLVRQIYGSIRKSNQMGQDSLNPAALEHAARQQNQRMAEAAVPHSAPDPRLAEQKPLGIGSPWDRPGSLPIAAQGTSGAGVSSTPGPMLAGPTAQQATGPLVGLPIPNSAGTAAGQIAAPNGLSYPPQIVSNATQPQLPQITPAGAVGQLSANSTITPASGISGPGGVQLGSTIAPFESPAISNAYPSPAPQPVGQGLQLGNQAAAPVQTQDPSAARLPASASEPQKGRFPGVLPDSVQNLLPSIRNAAERTLPSIRPFAGAEPTATPLPAAAPDIGALVASLESQLAAAAPGQTEAERLDYVHRHVNLRMLYLIAGRPDQALEPIRGIDANEQEFWQQMVWAVANYFDAQGMPRATDRATQTVAQLRKATQQLQQQADLELRSVTFCQRIDSYGNYERLSRDQFSAGVPVLLYAEVDNFRSVLAEGDRHMTALKSTIEFYKAHGDGKPLHTIPFDVSQDYCRNRRRDYFLAYEFTVPQQFEPGTYTLVLRVEDQLSQKVATAKANFAVE